MADVLLFLVHLHAEHSDGVHATAAFAWEVDGVLVDGEMIALTGGMGKIMAAALDDAAARLR